MSGRTSSERTSSGRTSSATAMNVRRANEFELMRSLSFGPYLPADSPLRRLDPRTRILLIVLFLTAFILANRPAGLVLGLAVALAGWWLGKASFNSLWRTWRAALPFLLILAVLQVLLRTGEKGETVLLSVGWLAITITDLWFGLALLIRFSGFIAVLALGASFLSESELTRGLEGLLSPLTALRIPTYDFVMVIQVTLRYLPLLSQASERIAKAQASRGADWEPTGWNLVRRARQIIPMIVPLFVSSLRRAENMALAMDARGYGTLPVRTSMVTLHYHHLDAIVLVITTLLLIAVVFL